MKKPPTREAKDAKKKSFETSGRLLLALVPMANVPGSTRQWPLCLIARWQDSLRIFTLKIPTSCSSWSKTVDRTAQARPPTHAHAHTLHTQLSPLFPVPADDNRYDPGVVPTISFNLWSDCLTCINNEKGFEEKHVRALCNVGASTKGTGGSGFIGQKGIGFKSVFRVTDYPEVHSNGFHFKLDVDHKAKLLPDLSYRPTTVQITPTNHSQVIPILCPPPPRNLLPDPNEMCRTAIVLPLNAEMLVKTDYLASKFEDLSALLLLFLNQLRRLIIRDLKLPGEATVRDMSRSDGADGVVTLSVRSN